VVDRIFSKYSNDTLKQGVPSKEEIDSLNYAIGVNNAAQTRQYQLLGDSTGKQTKAYLKGLKKGLEKTDEFVLGAENFGIQLRQASSGAGIFGDSTLMADKKLIAQGMINAVKKADKVFADKDAQWLQMFVQTTAQRCHLEKMKTQYADYKNKCTEFLDENAKKDSVVVLESGLQYKVITEGKGALPDSSSTVKVHYHGTLIDGTVFDSSVDRGQPAEFPVTGVIKGWTEALLKMPVGSKWTLYIPADLAYGSDERGTIKPFSALIFEVELLEIVKEEE